ncbi:TetR/AcrR family transcriptional regulator [Amycolatopsis marina]|uniref:TetR/AcrR family transcriptional regulator n=1 Tax=Amycolatopsis marina TaxID=490629 RepID=UPI000B838B88|nr:TetR/AcrR family transcriptional regulator [Amycolatopsis marina]
MTSSRTARQRARAELTQEIKDRARRQLAEVGADGLSLRAVARELGMVSSALYRYFASRDQLLTALIIDAYNALGDTAEAAVETADTAHEQWLALCHAVRGWAKANPHEYALIYGSPIPGYQAPEDTIAPASRVAIAFIGILARDEAEHGLRPPLPGPELTPVLDGQLRRLAADLAPDLPPEALGRAIFAWTQLFGMISFELFGQLVGSVDPADEFFAHSASQLAEFVGLRRQQGEPCTQ